MSISINTALIKNYIQNYEIDDIVYNGESIEDLIIDDEKIFSKIFTYTLLENGTYSIGLRDKTYSGAITIPNTFKGVAITAIEDSGFYGSPITSINFDVNSQITTIGSDAFMGCTKLSNIIIPDSVTTIGSSAFGHSGLTSITLSNNLSNIEDYTFSACRGLLNIVIPDSVTTIGTSAFSECETLSSVNIPDGVTTIGAHAFYNCSKLEQITIPSSVTNIQSYAFSQSGLKSAAFTCKTWTLSSMITNTILIENTGIAAQYLISNYVSYSWGRYNIIPPTINLTREETSLTITITNNNPIALTSAGRVKYMLNDGRTPTYTLNNSSIITSANSQTTLLHAPSDSEGSDVAFNRAIIELYFEEDYSENTTRKVINSHSVVGNNGIVAPQVQDFYLNSVNSDTGVQHFSTSIYNNNEYEAELYIIMFDKYDTVVYTSTFLQHAGYGYETFHIYLNSSISPVTYEIYYKGRDPINSSTTIYESDHIGGFIS